MIAQINEPDRYEPQFDDSTEYEQFERFTYRRRGEFPVRSQAARTRARLRERGTFAARNKSRAFNGPNRRGRGRNPSPAR
jgi:hypothetical protein